MTGQKQHWIICEAEAGLQESSDMEKNTLGTRPMLTGVFHGYRGSEEEYKV